MARRATGGGGGVDSGERFCNARKWKTSLQRLYSYVCVCARGVYNILNDNVTEIRFTVCFGPNGARAIIRNGD